MRGFIAGLLVASLVLGLIWWKSTPSADAPTTAATEAAALDETAAWDEEPASTPRTAPGGLSQPPPANVAEAHARKQARRAQERKEIDRLAATGQRKLVGQYQREPVDHAWATAMTAELTSLATSEQIQAIQAEPGNLKVDCRSSVCRIGADFPNRTSADDWSTLYLTGLSAKLPRASMRASTNPDGSVHLEMYGYARPVGTATVPRDRSLPGG